MGVFFRPHLGNFCKDDQKLFVLKFVLILVFLKGINVHDKKRNKFESVRPGQMDLESIIQSEVSQKNKYRILTHVYEI